MIDSTAQLIEARASLYRRLRAYFESTGALEVEVPVIGRAAATDVALQSFPVTSPVLGAHYLQTSPEFFLKRLLARMPRSIYCITKAFRDEEQGRLHNPEFSMLEWYRVSCDLEGILADTLALVAAALGPVDVRQCSYANLFAQYLNLDPHRVELAELHQLVRRHTSYDGEIQDRDEALQLLLNQVIEPQFDTEFTLIYHYPQGQAALARLTRDDQGREVAERFELYWRQMELANGYRELIDADEQARRFTADNRARASRGLPQMPADQKLIDALAAGLPECAGVSIGLDRLLACQLGRQSIEDLLLFPWIEL